MSLIQGHINSNKADNWLTFYGNKDTGYAFKPIYQAKNAIAHTWAFSTYLCSYIHVHY